MQNAVQRGAAPDTLGFGNTVTADPPVKHPNETPCVVQLFSGFQFTNYTPQTFPYAPPSSCAGPWAKVVLDGDFAVTAGRQFDRTGSIWIAGTNVYFGTTAEPSSNLGPHWHVERDVTGLSAVFTAPSTGEVVLGNTVDQTYTGIISGSAKLEFYPAAPQYPAPAVADNVYPLSGGQLGDNQYITNTPLTATYTLPTNVSAAYLDVFLQSQSGDEFWYTCFPDDLAQQLNNCPNTAFREGDVAIDGVAAGVVPVYPWIYTGGIDPYLWRPIPGVETLNFKPYRVNLTPFASILSNGQPHTVTVNVFNNAGYFAANAALELFLDHGSSHVTGGIISNTTTLNPSPVVVEGVKTGPHGIARGPISVTSSHAVAVDGYVNLSTGRVETQVQQQINFSNLQQITASNTMFYQNIKQDTTVSSNTTTTYGAGRRDYVSEQKDWPLTLNYAFVVNPDGSATQQVFVTQGKIEQLSTRSVGGGSKPYTSSLSNTVSANDLLTFPASGGYTPSNGKSKQTYIQTDSTGYCYNKTIKSTLYILTSQSGGFC